MKSSRNVENRHSVTSGRNTVGEKKRPQWVEFTKNGVAGRPIMNTRPSKAVIPEGSSHPQKEWGTKNGGWPFTRGCEEGSARSL